MGRALEVVLPRRERPPGAEPFLDFPVVRKHVQIKGVQVAVVVVAHDNLARHAHLAVGTVAAKQTVGKSRPLMPRPGGHIEHPSGVGRGENQDVEGVAFLLVGISHRVRDVAVALNGKLDGVGGNALAGVAVGPVHDATAAGVRPQPEQAVV